MSRRPISQFVPDLPAAALGLLDGEGPRAAWLIDVDRGQLVAASAGGMAVLDLGGRDGPQTFDAAMPALRSLRALTVADDARERTEVLVFWTRGGVAPLLCDVLLIADGGRRLAAVRAREWPRASGASEASTPSAGGDDAANLNDIARRIREGQLAGVRAERRRLEASPRAVVRPPARAPGLPPLPHGETDATLRAHLAHEIRTPLSSIAAAAELMKEQRLGPIGSTRYLGYARDIHATAQHALAVVERMLAQPAEAASGADALSFSEVDAADLLTASVSQLGPLAEWAGITLTLDVAPRLPRVVADVTSLRQIVLNLMTNAMKFTDRGGQVTVSAHHQADGPLTIAISDTGSGMNARELKQALGGRPVSGRRPAKARATPKVGIGPGLGLGLPLVRALAATNGAELVIESAPGRGTSAAVVFRKDRVVPV